MNLQAQIRAAAEGRACGRPGASDRSGRPSGIAVECARGGIERQEAPGPCAVELRVAPGGIRPVDHSRRLAVVVDQDVERMQVQVQQTPLAAVRSGASRRPGGRRPPPVRRAARRRLCRWPRHRPGSPWRARRLFVPEPARGGWRGRRRDRADRAPGERGGGRPPLTPPAPRRRRARRREARRPRRSRQSRMPRPRAATAPVPSRSRRRRRRPTWDASPSYQKSWPPTSTWPFATSQRSASCMRLERAVARLRSRARRGRGRCSRRCCGRRARGSPRRARRRRGARTRPSRRGRAPARGRTSRPRSDANPRTVNDWGTPRSRKGDSPRRPVAVLDRQARERLGDIESMHMRQRLRGPVREWSRAAPTWPSVCHTAGSRLPTGFTTGQPGPLMCPG